MGFLKEFFGRRSFIGCLIFVIPLSFLFTWRLIYVRQAVFFTEHTGKIYLKFLVANFLGFMLVFYILYLLSRRRQQMDD